MEKLGNTEFQWESLNIEINGKVFVPVKVLNEVRREALEQLRETLLSQNRREMVKKQKNVLLVIKRGTEREKTVKKGEKNVARLALLTDGT